MPWLFGPGAASFDPMSPRYVYNSSDWWRRAVDRAAGEIYGPRNLPVVDPLDNNNLDPAERADRMKARATVRACLITLRIKP
jgi:hypothetical protein